MATSTKISTGEMDAYERYIDATSPAFTFSSERPDGKKVHYVGTLPLTEAEVGIPVTSKAIRRERHRCRVLGIARSCTVCDRRLCHLGGIIDTQGAWLYRSNEGIEEEQRYKRDLIHASMKSKKIENICIRVIDEEVPFPKFEGHQDNGTPWSHTYISYDDVTDESIDTKKLQETTNKYTPLICSILKTIWGQEGLRESIEIFIRLAEESTYGEKIIPGAEWLMMVLDKISLHAKGKERFHHLMMRELTALVGDIIFSSRTDSGVITDYHQANGGNVLGLLQIANTETAMRKLMEQRICPTLYQRRVAPPKMGNIQEAEKILGHFSNIIHTLEELRELPNTVTVRDSTDDSGATEEGITSDVYASMKASAKKKDPRQEKFNFAARSKSSILRPRTLTELMEMIDDGRITKLQLDVSPHSMTYTAKTTLARTR